MIGHVDNSGRAFLYAKLFFGPAQTTVTIDAWVDTGFTGDLVLPQFVIDQFQLPKSGSVDAVLADGSQIELSTYTCVIEWFGAERRLEVIANNGTVPLIGVGLLLGKELRVDFRNNRVSLMPVASESG